MGSAIAREPKGPAMPGVLTSVLLFFGALPLAGAAQETAMISGATTCETCTLGLRSTVILQGLPTEGLSPDGDVGVLSDGFIAGPTLGGHRVIVYDREGEIMDAFGRAGEGPGEFSNLLQFVPHWEDSLAVVDHRQRRMTMVGRTHPTSEGRMLQLPVVPLRPPAANLVHRTDQWVTTGLDPFLCGVDHPLHVISPEGDLVESFGEATGCRSASLLSPPFTLDVV